MSNLTIVKEFIDFLSSDEVEKYGRINRMKNFEQINLDESIGLFVTKLPNKFVFTIRGQAVVDDFDVDITASYELLPTFFQAWKSNKFLRYETVSRDELFKVYEKITRIFGVRLTPAGLFNRSVNRMLGYCEKTLYKSDDFVITDVGENSDALGIDEFIKLLDEI